MFRTRLETLAISSEKTLTNSPVGGWRVKRYKALGRGVIRVYDVLACDWWNFLTKQKYVHSSKFQWCFAPS